MFSAPTLVLWGTITVLKLVLALKCRDKFFMIYLATSFANSVTLWALTVGHNSRAYFYTYYFAEFSENVLILVFTLNLCREMFFPYVIIPRKSRRFALSAITLVGCILSLNAVLSPSRYPELLVIVYRTAEKWLAGLTLIALLEILGLAWFLCVPFRSVNRCLVIGLLPYLVIQYVFSAATLSTTFPILNRLQWVHPLSYLFAEAVWVWGLQQPVKARQRVNAQHLEHLGNLLRKQPQPCNLSRSGGRVA